ncbi:MAG: flagellar biosynthetic protein FliR [Aeromonas sp.]
MSSLLTLSAAELMGWLGLFWWPFVRFAAAFAMMPIFGDARIPAQVRIFIVLVLSLLMAPLLKDMPEIDPFSASAIVLTLEQIMYGLLFGTCLNMLYMVMTMAGQILSIQMGLSMAMINDPATGTSAPIISQLMQIFCSLLFIAVNGHLAALDILTQSLYAWPPGSSLELLNLKSIVGLLGWSIGAALILALPAIIAMLMVNVSFGVMNKVAQSLNVFALSFPLGLLMGLITLGLSVSGVPVRYMGFVDYILRLLEGLVLR